ncbi:class I SAM-dependent methyltransferase [Bradyrhizobium japonicum]|nr:class I SAM-dependent methyltransferase [Bradyrhizobium japonicum]
MDLSHSRPHRAFEYAPIKPFNKFLVAVDHVLKNCISHDQADRGPATRISLGDARKLPLPSGTIDLVLTSPPYLNAIDYMRCSKFSLVWMGYSVGELGSIRSESVGTECSDQSACENEDIKKIISDLRLKPKLAPRQEAILAHYIDDMMQAVKEAARVLSPNGRAVYVVGENTVRGTFIPNAKIVAAVAEQSGLITERKRTRALPANRRYLPPPTRGASTEALNGRMRREAVLSFCKS